MPKEKPRTSASARVEQAMESTQKRAWTSSGANATPAATAIAVWEITEGMAYALLLILGIVPWI